MTFATGARHSLSYVAESTFGTTPGTPSMKFLRNTSVGLNMAKDTFVSAEIRSDRQIVDLRHGTKKPAGDIGFELSYGAFDDFLEAALFGTWATNVLKAGTALKSFSMERLFSDITEYMVFVGCVVNTMRLTIAPNAMVTGTLGILAKDMSVSTTSLGTPSDVATNPPFDGFTGSINEGGSAIASITSIELNLDNGITPTFVVGDDTAPQMVPGQSNLTGTLSAYFADATLLSKFLDETESSISITLEGASGGDLTIDIPRVKYTGGDVPASNANDALALSLPFQALYSSSDSTNLKITRTPDA